MNLSVSLQFMLVMVETGLYKKWDVIMKNCELVDSNREITSSDIEILRQRSWAIVSSS